MPTSRGGTIPKNVRITGATRDRLANNLKRKYERGASIRALAEATGRSYGFVRNILIESGVTLRGRSGTVTTTNRRTQRRSR